MGYASSSRPFEAKVEEGKLKFANRDELLAYLRSLEGRKVTVVLTPQAKSQSNEALPNLSVRKPEGN